MRLAFLSFFAASLAFPQAVVERALGTARSTSAVAPASNTGKQIGGVFNKLSKTLDQAGKPANSSAATPAAAGNGETIIVPAMPPPKKGAPLDLQVVKPGMEIAMLIEKFGSPEYKIAGSDGETWYYTTADRESVALTVALGKVTKVIPPRADKTAAVVIR